MTRRRLEQRQPYERMGHCCGCGADDVKLLQVAPDRYRCARVCAPKEQAGHSTTWIVPTQPRRVRTVASMEAHRWWAAGAALVVAETDQAALGEGYCKLAAPRKLARCLACGGRLEKGQLCLAVVVSPHGGWTWGQRYMHRQPCVPAPTVPA